MRPAAARGSALPQFYAGKSHPRPTRPQPQPSIGRRSWSWTRMGAYVTAGFCLLLVTTIFLGSNTPQVEALRRLATGRGRDGQPLHADEAASSLLFRTYVESAGMLRAEDTAPLLLASLIGTPEDSNVIVSHAAEVLAASWNSSSSVGGSSTLPFGPQDPIPLFILAACKAWRGLAPPAIVTALPFVEAAVERLESRVSPGGFYLLEQEQQRSNASSSSSAVVHALRQAAAMAALRCASSILARPSLAVTAALMLRQLHTLYQPALLGAGSPFLLSAALTDTGAGLRPSPLPLGPDALHRTAEVGTALFFLDPADVPDAVIGRIAAAVVEVSTLAGLRAADVPAATAAASGGFLTAAGVAWRVSPVEQALALIGAAKHLSFINDREYLVRAAAAEEEEAAAEARAVAEAARGGPAPDEEGYDESYGNGGEGEGEGGAEEGGEAEGEGRPRRAEGDTAPEGGKWRPQLETDYNPDAISLLYGGGGAPRQEDGDSNGLAGFPSAPGAHLGGGDSTTEVTMALLRRVIEVSARVAPLLEQLDRESTARSLARDLANAVSKALPRGPTPSSAPAQAVYDGAGGVVVGAPSSVSPAPPAAAGSDPLARLAAAAHRFAFPEFLIPLPRGEAPPINPSLAAPILPAWTLLKNAALSRLLASRAGEYAVRVVTLGGRGGGKGASNSTVGRVAGAMAALAGAASGGGPGGKALGKLIDLVYPMRGLKVVRVVLPGAPGAAAPLPDDSPLQRAVEQVVVEAAVSPEDLVESGGAGSANGAADGDAAAGEWAGGGWDAEPSPTGVKKGAMRGGGKLVRVPLRGDGQPLSLSTAVACRFFRTLAELSRGITVSRSQSKGKTQVEPGALSAFVRARSRLNSALLAPFRRRALSPALDDLLAVLLAPRSAVYLIGTPGGQQALGSGALPSGRESLAAEFTFLDHPRRVAAAQALEAARRHAANASASGGEAAPAPPAAAAAVAAAVGGGHTHLPGAPEDDAPPAPQLKVGAVDRAGTIAPEAFLPQVNALPQPVAAAGPEPTGRQGAPDAVVPPVVPVAAPLPFEMARAVRREGLEAAVDEVQGAALRTPPPAPGIDAAATPAGAETGAEAHRRADAAKEEAEAEDDKHAHQPRSAAEVGEALAAAEAVAAAAAQHDDAPGKQQHADTAAAGGVAAPAAAPAGAAAVATTPTVNILDLYTRLCPSDEQGNPLPTAYARPWAESCCGTAMADLVLAHADAPDVAVELLPVFSCRSRAPGASEAVTHTSIPCSRVADDYCDCTYDFADEPLTSACAASAGVFKCTTRVLTVQGGALLPAPAAAAGAGSIDDMLGKPPSELHQFGYIPATKVGDGIVDCEGGEDELSGAESAVVRPQPASAEDDAQVGGAGAAGAGGIAAAAPPHA